jgi:hypothetical protein
VVWAGRRSGSNWRRRQAIARVRESREKVGSKAIKAARRPAGPPLGLLSPRAHKFRQGNELRASRFGLGSPPPPSPPLIDIHCERRATIGVVGSRCKPSASFLLPCLNPHELAPAPLGQPFQITRANRHGTGPAAGRPPGRWPASQPPEPIEVAVEWQLTSCQPVPLANAESQLRNECSPSSILFNFLKQPNPDLEYVLRPSVRLFARSFVLSLARSHSKRSGVNITRSPHWPAPAVVV